MLYATLTPILLIVQAAWFITPGLIVALYLQRTKRIAPLYIVAISIVVSSLLAYGVFWAYIASPGFGRALSWIIGITSLLALYKICANKTTRRVLFAFDVGVPLILWLVACFAYASVTFGCRTVNTVSAPDQFCYVSGITFDNLLPKIFANNVFHGQAKTLIGDWHGSDRPPLQSGAVLLESPLTQSSGVGIMSYQLLATFLQMAWIPVVWLLGRKLRLNNKQLAVLLVFCLCSGFFFFNSIFTWPKLLAGSLGGIALALLLFEKPSRAGWSLAGAAIGTALLSHGGVAFTFVAIIPLLLTKWFFPGWKIALSAVAAVLIIFAPWTAYQHFYDPPGNRVLKWEIAGVIPIDDRSFDQALVDSYKAAGVRAIVHNKRTNATTLIYNKAGSSYLYSTGKLGKLRDAQFRFVLFSIGLLNLGWFILLVPRWRKRLASSAIDMSKLWLMLGIAGAALVAWVALMFGPYSTIIHQGSYLTMLLLFVCLGAAVTTMPKRILAGYTALYVLCFAALWIFTIYVRPLHLHSGPYIVWSCLSTAALAGLLGVVAWIEPRTIRQRLRRTWALLGSAYQRSEAWLKNHPSIVLWGTVGLCAALALTRRPETITQAQFWAEDGRYWYAQAYAHGWSVLFATYSGYFVVIYRVVAEASMLLPLHVAPLFFNLVALGIQLLPIVLLMSNRMRSIIPSRLLALGLCVVYIGIPNATEVFANLTNIQWHLGIASFLVLIAYIPQSRAWRVFDFTVLALTGLSGPLVILLAPIAGFLWWRMRRATQWRNLILLVALSCLQIASILFISHFHRVGSGQPDANGLYLLEMVVGQIFTGGLLGQMHVNLLYGSVLAMLGALVLGGGIMAYCTLRGPLWLKLCNAYFVILFISMLLSIKPIPGFDTWWGLANPGGGQRYWYIPMFIWIINLVWVTFKAKLLPLRIATALLLAILVLVGMPNSWRLPALPDLQFSKHAQAFEQAPAGTHAHIPINPGWEMDLVKK